MAVKVNQLAWSNELEHYPLPVLFQYTLKRKFGVERLAVKQLNKFGMRRLALCIDRQRIEITPHPRYSHLLNRLSEPITQYAIESELADFNQFTVSFGRRHDECSNPWATPFHHEYTGIHHHAG